VTLFLFLMSMTVVINIYLAQRSQSKRPEVFYGAAGLMLFAALLVASGIIQ
jgi:hypothetical protein